MNSGIIQTKFGQSLEEKFRSKLGNVQTKFRTRSRFTHFEIIQINLEKKNRFIQDNSEHIRIQTNLDKIQTPPCSLIVFACIASASMCIYACMCMYCMHVHVSLCTCIASTCMYIYISTSHIHPHACNTCTVTYLHIVNVTMSYVFFEIPAHLNPTFFHSHTQLQTGSLMRFN